jgi:hypothetical protein
MKNLMISTLLLFANLILAQVNHNSKESGTFQTGNIDSPFLRVSQQSGNKIEGSIYLNENWEQATIIDGNSYKTTSMARFNAYHSEIEIFNQNNISSLFPKQGLKVILNDKTFVSIKLQDKLEPIFGELLVDGKNKLYRIFDIKINRAPSDAKLLNIESIDKVVVISNLFYGTDEEVLKFPTRNKDIKNTLTPKMLKLAKKENISLKKENEIIQFFTTLNTKE